MWKEQNQCEANAPRPGTDVPRRDWRLPAHAERGYTFDMKTAISIPDEVYAGAEKLARAVSSNAEAVAEYLARHDPEAITDAMNRVCEQVGAESDPGVSAAARRILERTEWK